MTIATSCIEAFNLPVSPGKSWVGDRMTTEKLKLLENLVDELLKAEPKESIVKKYMSDAGIEDGKDPVDRINKVLLALHFQEKDKEIK